MSEPREEDSEFEALLDYLRRSRGFNFSGYKRASLIRRVDKRMAAVGVQGYGTYVDFLEVHPEEFGQLFDTILINVTTFFRDPASWEALGVEILPRLLSVKRPTDPIRLWSAGCASGEEAYSLAMALAEVLGPEQVRERVKIYATDVDSEALARARQAQYDAKEVEGLPPGFLAKYFEADGSHYTFLKDLRRAVIFGRHDLIQDAPISRIDLLVCRNTLMYFNPETQSRILDRFHFALADRGFLFLGKAETLLTYNNSFSAVDLKRRIFAKVSRGIQRERLMMLARTGNGEAVNHLVGHIRLRELAFDVGPTPQVMVDFSGLLVVANEPARTLFNLAAGDLGRPLSDLSISYRPADLRSGIDRAYSERRPVSIPEVEWSGGLGQTTYLEVHIVPLVDTAECLLGACVTFLDVTAVKHLRDDLQATGRELEATNEEFQSANEELETTNEELQSTIEELETTNEELQSTNEELETMNEELQSTNEELETVNDELRLRSDERNQANVFLESILSSLRGGVAVVDAEFRVHVWNPQAADLWGLRGEEVRGKNILNLDIGLPVDQLRTSLRACLAGETTYEEAVLDARNRRGKRIRCRVTCTPMPNGPGPAAGAVLMMEDLEAATLGPVPFAENDGGAP